MNRVLFFSALLAQACNIGLDPIQGNKDNHADDSSEPQAFGNLVVSATSLNFGEVEMGSSTSDSVTLRNDGDVAIALNSVELMWGQGFAISSTVVESLDAGADNVVTLEFAPIIVGEHGDTLVIETDAEGADHVEVALSGWGTEVSTTDDSGGSNDPSVTVSQQNINFGTVDIGQEGRAPIEIANVGSSDITIVRFTSSDRTFDWADDFTLPYILRAGTTRTANLTYTPTAETTNRGTITIETSDPVRPEIDVAVQGQGYARCSICAPLIDVYTSSGSTTELSGLISFSCQPGTGTITIQNIGDEALVINGMSVTNDTVNGTFSLSGWSGTTTLNPWDTTTVSVSYSSTATVLWEGRYELFGSVFNVLNIISNDPSHSNYEVSLVGAGTGC